MKRSSSAPEEVPPPAAAQEGRRARKARETRMRIADAGLRLFLEHGFDQVTLDAIAEAADVSRRTIFHYFASKEAILQVVEDGAHQAFRDALATIPDTVAAIDAVEQSLLQMVGRYQSEEAAAIDRLMRSTDALRARKQANYERQEQALFAALCDRWPQPVRRAALRMVAMAGIGAQRIATECWRNDSAHRPLAIHIRHTFAELRRELGR